MLFVIHVAAETAALITDYMSVGVTDGYSITYVVSSTTAAANAIGVMIVDCSVAVPKDICDRSCGGFIQG